MDKLEVRVIGSSFEFDDDNMTVEGLVNKTESWSYTLGDRKKFKEKISKSSFSRALIDAPRVDFLAEHDDSKLLSTTENGSLHLWEDEEGLKMRANICPTSYGKDMYQLIKSKIVNHMSFGFRVLSDKWKKINDGTFERVIDSLELIEVSVVRNPAYPQSAIASRGLKLVEDVDIPEDVDTPEVKDDERRSEDMDEKNIEKVNELISVVEDKLKSLKEFIETNYKKDETEDEDKPDVKNEDVKNEDVKNEEDKPDEEDDEKKEDSSEGRSFDLNSYKNRLKVRR